VPSALVVATNNENKVYEIRNILDTRQLDLRHLAQYPEIPSPPETGSTFVANALQKSLFACNYLNLPCCADDSGITVSALGDEPGIHSARYSGENATDEANNELLLENMESMSNRRAFFSCALALAVPETHMQKTTWRNAYSDEWSRLSDQDVYIWTAETTVFGYLLREPQGTWGFGYDPLFYYDPAGMTFAEMSTDTKNEVSHRGMALRLFAEQLK